MRLVKHKNILLKLVICCVAVALTLSNVYFPKASAADSYFTAEGSTLALDEIPTEQDPLVSVTIKAAREMTIHSMHGHFTPISGEDEELERYMSWMDYSSGISTICFSTSTGEFDWNIPGCIDDVVGDEGIHVQAGDPLIYVTFEVKDGVDVMKRSMPVNLDFAIVDEGSETGKRIENVNMDAYVRAGHTLSVYKSVLEEEGDLDVPATVIGGTDLEVRIVPKPGFELIYLELNGQEITDQVKDNVYRMTAGTENLYFSANFGWVYHVLEGDGGEHILGSDEALAFKIDTDVTEFCNQGVLSVDDEYLDMRYECEVNPENQTIILPASFLNTLGLGEHSFDAWFSEPESGSARATFKIVEESKDNPGIPVPDTGVFTGEGGGIEVVNDDLFFAVIIGVVAVAWLSVRQAKRE